MTAAEIIRLCAALAGTLHTLTAGMSSSMRDFQRQMLSAWCSSWVLLLLCDIYELLLYGDIVCAALCCRAGKGSLVLRASSWAHPTSSSHQPWPA